MCRTVRPSLSSTILAVRGYTRVFGSKLIIINKHFLTVMIYVGQYIKKLRGDVLVLDIIADLF